MSGKSAGQLAYEALHASIGRRQPQHIWVTWDAVNEINDGIPGEPLREDLEAAAAAVETEQVRLARQDRDQLRGQVLGLAADLEESAAITAPSAKSRAESAVAARLRKIAEPQ